jgi:acetylornithine deacetylase/succinyl-diaminopimelate desuccinylase-like protein
VRQTLEAWLGAKGWTVVADPPTPAQRLAHSRLVRVQWEPGYPAERTDMALPAARAVSAAVSRATGAPVLALPMLGGSVPMYLFADLLHTPVIGVPIANHDNNQHAANENLRLQNLWDGIDVYAALLGDLNW